MRSIIWTAPAIVASRILDTPYLLLCRLSRNAVEILRIHYERGDWQVEL